MEQKGLVILNTGDGFTWKSRNLDHSAELSGAAWEQAETYILTGDNDVIASDEFTYPLSDYLGWGSWNPCSAGAVPARDELWGS